MKFLDGLDGTLLEGIEDKGSDVGSTSDCRCFDGIDCIDHHIMIIFVDATVVVNSFGIAGDEGGFFSRCMDAAAVALRRGVPFAQSISSWRLWVMVRDGIPPSRLFAAL
jgi:hypothetical protein